MLKSGILKVQTLLVICLQSKELSKCILYEEAKPLPSIFLQESK